MALYTAPGETGGLYQSAHSRCLLVFSLVQLKLTHYRRSTTRRSSAPAGRGEVIGCLHAVMGSFLGQ